MLHSRIIDVSFRRIDANQNQTAGMADLNGIDLLKDEGWDEAVYGCNVQHSLLYQYDYDGYSNAMAYISLLQTNQSL